MVSSILLQFLSFFFVIISTVQCENAINGTRTLTTKVLCSDKETALGFNTNLVHTQAVGPSDELHYLLTTVGVPSVLVARTPLDTSVNVDCAKFLSVNDSQIDNTVIFTKKPNYVYSMLFPMLIEYDDIADSATLPNDSLWRITDLALIPWENCSDTSHLRSHTIIFVAKKDNTGIPFFNNGSLTFRFQVYDREGRDYELPHLAYNNDVIQWDITLDHVNPYMNHSRFAIQMILVTTDPNSTKTDIRSTLSIDDEFTPGIFKMMDWLIPSGTQYPGVYVQWKPVCYTKPEKTVQSATGANYANLEQYTKEDFPKNVTLLHGFFGVRLTEGDLLMAQTKVVFGLSGDGFYNPTQYLMWSAALGLGTAPEDEVSSLIIIVISIGLGLPVIILIIGGLCVCIKKQRGKIAPVPSYQPVR